MNHYFLIGSITSLSTVYEQTYNNNYELSFHVNLEFGSEAPAKNELLQNFVIKIIRFLKARPITDYLFLQPKPARRCLGTARPVCISN